MAGLSIDPEQDPRTEAPNLGTERETLVGFLRWQRETVDLKCSGLDAEQLARRSVEPSSMSLLGLVRHLADVERGWFRRVMAGEDAPPIYRTEADRDACWSGAVADPGVVAEAFAAWRSEIAYADRFVAEAPDLEIAGEHPWEGPVSLRMVLVHMIEEYARHNGHADLLRERIDVVVGQ